MSDLKRTQPMKPKPWEQAILGVVNTGGKIVKGAAGLASMATDEQMQKRAGRAAPLLKKIHSVAEREYRAAGDTLKKDVEPSLGGIGKATSLAASLAPGVRALDIPVAVGEKKTLSAAIAPAAAVALTRKLPSAFYRSATQQAISENAPSVAPEGRNTAYKPSKFFETTRKRRAQT